MARFAAVLLVLALIGVAAASWDHVKPEDLTTCKSAIKMVPELKNKPDGYTIFCPTNEAWSEFAETLGFEGENPVAQLMSSASQGPAMLKSIVAFHATKGVMPAANIKNGALIKTLEPGANIKLIREGDDIEVGTTFIDLEDTAHDDPDHTDFISATDFTFDGEYSAKSKYVVHVLDRVLVPQSAATALRELYLSNVE